MHPTSFPGSLIFQLQTKNGARLEKTPKCCGTTCGKALATSRSPSRFLDQIFHLFERISADLVYRGGCSIHIQQPDFPSWFFVGQVQVKGNFKMNPTYPNWKIPPSPVYNLERPSSLISSWSFNYYKHSSVCTETIASLLGKTKPGARGRTRREGSFICLESVIDRCSVEASFFYSVSFYHKIRRKLIDSNFNNTSRYQGASFFTLVLISLLFFFWHQTGLYSQKKLSKSNFYTTMWSGKEGNPAK